MPRVVTTAVANASVPWVPSLMSGINSRTIVASGTTLVLNDFEYSSLSATAFTSGALLDGGDVKPDGMISASRAAAILPQTATGNIFTVTGRVLVKRLIGEVVVVLAATASNLRVLFDPAGADAATNLSADVAVISDPVGTLYSIVGVVATATVESALLHYVLPASTIPGEGILLTTGVIALITSGSIATGTVKWDIDYIPLSSGATIVAA